MYNCQKYILLNLFKVKRTVSFLVLLRDQTCHKPLQPFFDSIVSRPLWLSHNTQRIVVYSFKNSIFVKCACFSLLSVMNLMISQSLKDTEMVEVSTLKHVAIFVFLAKLHIKSFYMTEFQLLTGKTKRIFNTFKR